MFAFESALDELAEKADLDPVELRIRNHAATDGETGLPFTSNFLLECYERGRERFGWTSAAREPKTMREGKTLLGWGMATATYPAYKAPGSATVRVQGDGHVLIRSATQDIGTGTYTTMAQLTSDALQVPVERIVMELGDSRLPNAPQCRRVHDHCERGTGGEGGRRGGASATGPHGPGRSAQSLARGRPGCSDGSGRGAGRGRAAGQLYRYPQARRPGVRRRGEPDVSRPGNGPVCLPLLRRQLRRSAGGRRPGPGARFQSGGRVRRGPGPERQDGRSQIVGGIIQGIG